MTKVPGPAVRIAMVRADPLILARSCNQPQKPAPAQEPATFRSQAK